MSEKDLSFKEILESPAYHQQREVIRNEINNLPHERRYAFPRFATPGELIPVDRSVYKKTDDEKGQLLTLKARTPKTKMKTLFRGSF